MPSYWLVGAMYGGSDDRFAEFVDGGWWRLNWTAAERPQLTRWRDQIRVGDRIAIKRNIVRPDRRYSSRMRIRAVGTVTAAATAGDDRVYARWIRVKTQRRVRTRGCYAAISAPFPRKKKPQQRKKKNDEARWIARVFREIL